MRLRELTVGVEVLDVDLCDAVDDTIVEQLRAAYREHHLLLFRGQHLSGDRQVEVVSWFGPVLAEKMGAFGFVSNVIEGAVVPEGATLTVRSNFEAAPGHPAVGLGDLAGKASARMITQRYQAALERDGWTVQVGRFDSLSGDLPPEPIHWCIVEGRKDGRVQRLSIDIAGRGTDGSLWWTVGPAKFPIGTTDRPCWTA